MLSINTNLSSLIAKNSMSSATKLLNQAVERMTTGYKINHSKDNAANYSIATNMTTKINSYMVAEDNCAMGLDMITTAEESLFQISNKLTRLRDLATQAGNGTYGTQSLNAINAEANALVDEINRLYSTAEYNGIKLFAEDTTAAPIATFAMARAAATPNVTYSEEEIADMIKFSTVDATECLASGIYSISTADDLAKLAQMSNSDKLDTNMANGDFEFVLANDIDLKAWCDAHAAEGGWTPIGNSRSFNGTFDGNGHVISNLTIDTTDSVQGLFGRTDYTEIKNLGLENVNIKGGTLTGGLIGECSNDISIKNCYVSGNISGDTSVGGLIGASSSMSFGSVTNSYVTGSVSGNAYVGGLIGISYLDISNCYTDTSVTSQNAGGFVEYVEYGTIENCFALGSVIGDYGSGFVGTAPGCDDIINCMSVQEDTSGWGVQHKTKEEILEASNLESMGFTEANGWKIANGQPMFTWQPDPVVLNGANYITLQVGIGSGEHSSIGLEFGFSLVGVDDLRMIGLDTTTDFLSQIDNMLATVNAKQTEFGAIENRLNSALDEISIQYDNLVSSRSTIRDADIAEVSSEYIRQQILQQASATLLATANQSPSIALQLI